MASAAKAEVEASLRRRKCMLEVWRGGTKWTTNYIVSGAAWSL
jgi:hypothetical protein